MQLNNRVRSVDLFKGIAMIMVIMAHFEQSFGICRWFQFLRMGCPVFFVCSGFGIMSLISKKYPSLSEDKDAMKAFLMSRFRSLAPGWYLAFILVFIANTVMILSKGHTFSFGYNRNPLAILINLFFLNGLFPFCNNNVMPGGWFIGTTAILYCMTPLILVFLNKCKSRKLFFIATSVVGMLFWSVLFLFFRESFSPDGFSYFFFLVHYPNYLLGIMLYLDIKDDILNVKQIKICLPIGGIAFVFAFLVFYSGLPFFNMLSAWVTSLATYLVLYYLISTETDRRETAMGKMLVAYGKNTYGIYLLHLFFAWPFVGFLEVIFNHFGISVMNLFGFIVLIPVVLFLCYCSGYVFNKVTDRMTRIVFK